MSELASPHHQRLTDYFIRQNPVDVVLNRSEVVPTGTGGTTRGTPEIVGIYRGRIVASFRQADSQMRTTANGDQVFATHILILPHETDIQIHDTFSANGDEYEVVGIQTSPPWRVNAEVFLHEQ